MRQGQGGRWKGSMQTEAYRPPRAIITPRYEESPAASPLRESAAGLFRRGGFVVGRIEDYAAVEAFAVAFGAEVRLVAEGEVDDATFTGRHGSEVERSSGLANFVSGDRGGHAELLEADGTLVLAIEGNLFVLGGR